MKFTKIIAKDNSKVPISDSPDGKFDFVTFEVSNNKIPEFIANNFWLSAPLQENGVHTSLRRKSDLPSTTEPEYVVLDLDGITSKSSLKRVVDYFINNNLPCLLMKSRSFDAKENFNIKGILKLPPEFRTNGKTVLMYLSSKLKNFCKVDTSCTRGASYQAPTRRAEVLFENLDSEYFLSEDPNIIFEKMEDKVDIFSLIDCTNNSEIVNWNLDHFRGLGFKEAFKNQNGSTQFSHPTEKTKNGYFWFEDSPFYMNHPNKERSVCSFNEFKNTSLGKQFLEEQFKRKLEEKLFGFRYAPKTNECIKQDRVRIDERIKENINLFLEANKNSALLVKSFMGSGKSEIIQEVIVQSRKKKQNRILILTNRVNSAFEFSEKYGIKTYLDSEQYIQGDSIIVQFESLWRYDLRDFDTIILDEFMGLILQHRSNLSARQSINIGKFLTILNTKRIVCLDAFMFGGIEYDFLKEKIEIFSITNEARDETPLTKIENEDTFTNFLVKCSVEGKKLSLSTTSLIYGKFIKKELEKYGKNVVLISSEVEEETRKYLLNYLLKERNSRENKIDLLIYTPTLTVGVNIMSDFEYHFHYDSGNSCDVISSIQMMKRVRNSEQIFFYIKNNIFNPDISSEKYIIDDSKLNEYASNEIKFLKDGVSVNFDKFGNPVLTEEQKYMNKIEAFSNVLDFPGYRNFVFERILMENFSSFKVETLIFKDRKISKRESYKEIREQEMRRRLESFNSVLQDFSVCDFHQIVFDRSRILTDEEKMLNLISETKQRLNKYNFDEYQLKDIVQYDIESQGQFVSMLKRLKIIFETKQQIKERLQEIVIENLNGDKLLGNYKKFLKALLEFEKTPEVWFKKSELKKHEIWLLQKCGYESREGRLQLNERFIPFI